MANDNPGLFSSAPAITPDGILSFTSAPDANGRANVAVAVPTEAEPAAPANALPVGFVAPPRTIADITAILDSEKPDVKKVIEDFKAFAKGRSLGDISIRELIEEGRRF